MAKDNGRRRTHPTQGGITVPRQLTLQLLLLLLLAGKIPAHIHPPHILKSLQLGTPKQTHTTHTRGQNGSHWKPNLQSTQTLRGYFEQRHLSSSIYNSRGDVLNFCHCFQTLGFCFCCCHSHSHIHWCYIYLFLLTALYFIYYIEFMSLCCHDQFGAKLRSFGGCPVYGAKGVFSRCHCRWHVLATQRNSTLWDVCLCHYCQVSI